MSPPVSVVASEVAYIKFGSSFPSDQEDPDGGGAIRASE